MKEIEPAVTKIAERYKKYGYAGPKSATTDRCCQDRKFWKRALGLVEGQIVSCIDNNDLDTINVVDASFKAQIAYNYKTALILVGLISDHLMSITDNRFRVIAVDGE